MMYDNKLDMSGVHIRTNESVQSMDDMITSRKNIAI